MFSFQTSISPISLYSQLAIRDKLEQRKQKIKITIENIYITTELFTGLVKSLHYQCYFGQLVHHMIDVDLSRLTSRFEYTNQSLCIYRVNSDCTF